MSANLIEFQPLQFVSRGNSPTRTHRSNSKSPTKKFKGRFHVMSEEKIFNHTQVKFKEPSILSEDPLLSDLSKQLQSTFENFDNKLIRALHKQETNFLMAYKGVMRDVGKDLKYYQRELDKNTQEYKDSENGYLKQQMVIFKEEISKVLVATKAFEEDNKKLRMIIINLKEELKIQKETLVKSETEKKSLQEICNYFKTNLQQTEKEAKNVQVKTSNVRPISAFDRQQTEISSNLLLHTPINDEKQLKSAIYFLETDNTSREKFDIRQFSADRGFRGLSEKNALNDTSRAKSPISNHDSSSMIKQAEFKHLAELVRDILREKVTIEEDVKILTEKVVNSAILFLRQKVKEAKVLKETVDRLQKTMQQKERIGTIDNANDNQRNENKILKEIFRECVEESTKSLLTNQLTLATSKDFLDRDKRKELQKRVELFERYLSHPLVVNFLENIIADRPLDYPHLDVTSRSKSNSVSLVTNKAQTDEPKNSKITDAANYQNYRIQESVTEETKNVGDTSNNWDNKAVYYFGQAIFPNRGGKDDESTSELLSEKDNQVLNRANLQTPTTATQDSRAIMAQSNSSLIYARNSRSNSSSGFGSKLNRGRLKMQQRNQNLSYANIDKSQVGPSDSFRVTTDNSTNLSKSPLSRRVYLRNGKAMFN